MKIREQVVFRFEQVRLGWSVIAMAFLVIDRSSISGFPDALGFLWVTAVLLPAERSWFRRGTIFLWALVLMFMPGGSPLAIGMDLLLLLLASAAAEIFEYWLQDGKRARQRLDALLGNTPAWTQQLEQGSLSSVSREEIAKRREEQSSLLNETLYSLLKSAAGILSATTVSLFWKNDEGVFGIREVYSDTEALNYKIAVKSGDGVLGWVVEQKRTWISSEISGTIDVPIYPRDEGIRSLLIQPVMRDQELVGLLYVDSRFVQAFDSGHQTTLEAFARLVVDHVKFNEIAATHDLEKSRAEAFFQAASSLLEPAGVEELMKRILDTALAVVPVDGAMLLIKSTRGNKPLTVQMVRGVPVERCFGLVAQEDSLVDWVCRTLQGVYATNTDSVVRPLLGKGGDPNAVQSVLVVPLSHNDGVTGALCLVSRDADRFSPHEIMIFEKLKQIIAVAIYQRQSYRSAKVLASTDPLTKLSNRRYFFRKLHSEVKRLSRSQQTGALVMIDIDFFKKINDEYGHQVGDEVLQRISALLRAMVREHDVLGRYGGEEFILFCPDTSLKSASKLAERIRRKVSQIDFSAGEKGFKISASFGIAEYPTHAQETEQLIQVADASLYEAKETGRNKVVVASSKSMKDAGTLSGSLG